MSTEYVAWHLIAWAYWLAPWLLAAAAVGLAFWFGKRKRS